MNVKTTWNRTTQTYTVACSSKVVRGIEAKAQATCVAIELRNGWEPSFGEVEVR